ATQRAVSEMWVMLMGEGGISAALRERDNSGKRGTAMRATCVLIGCLFAHNVATAQNNPTAPVPCARLRVLELPHTLITMAQTVAAGSFTAPKPPPIPGVPADYSRLPAFCRVAATISPVPGSTIKMEVWLPAEGWNGKFVGVGNGGFSGE